MPEALAKLLRAMSDVSREWEKLDDAGHSILAEKYPFHKDFTEMLHDAMDWVDSVKELL